MKALRRIIYLPPMILVCAVGGIAGLLLWERLEEQCDSWMIELTLRSEL